MTSHDTRFRILIVDDTPTIHQDFQKILCPASESAPQLDVLAAAVFGQDSPAPAPVHFKLDFATQGQAGLALVEDALSEDRPYALAFVDMRMPPGWDGLETVRHLWAADPHLQIVICTAYSDHSWAVIIEQLGQSDNLLILKKPFDHVEVLQLAHALCRKWRLAREVASHVDGLDGLLHFRTEELHRAEEGFTAAFEASPLAQLIVALDDDRILAVNEAFEKTLGLLKAEIMGGTVQSLGRGLDPVRWTELLDRLRLGGNIDHHPFVYQPSPVIRRELRCCARPLVVRGRLCSIWVLRDITEQIETEQQLRQSQKMEAIGQLAAGVAHDFNNLLTVIQGYTSELIAQHDHALTRQLLAPVQAAATRAANLTRQLLIFSRKEVVRPQKLDLVVIFNELRPLLRRLIGAHIGFQWNIPAKLAPIMADPANIEQIIVNLVVNARDAMPESGRIEIAARECRLEAGAPALPPEASPGEYIELSIADTGTGIKPEILARIFEPFFTTKEAGKGTGLGLSTVYSIVRQQGGWIQVHSEVGVGTTFTVYQPVVKATGNTAPATPAATSTGAPAACANALVVEDDPIVKNLLTEILRRRGIKHTMAEDGVIAQEIWRTSPQPFDLVITDIIMPNGINGLRLARILRQHNPQIPIILTSGFSELLFDPANVEMPGPPPKILLKPFSPSQLFEAIAEACAVPVA